jgi:hypothetical protein
MAPWKLVALGVVTELFYLGLYTPTSAGVGVALFIAVNALAFLPFGVVVRRALISKAESTPNTTSVVLIILFGMLFRLTLVPLSPVASDDIYRYIWDGKVALSGTNPFALAPDDPQLASLHNDDLPSKINFPYMRTIYPPLAQAFFFFSNVLFGDSVGWMKLLLTICDLCTVIMLVLLLNHLAINPAMVVLYAWCPLPIMYFGLDGHIDALGIPLLLLSIYLIMKNRTVAGAFALGLAGLAKLYPMFVVPLLLHAKKGLKSNAIVLLPLLIFAFGCWAYVEPTGGLVESFKVFNSQFEFNGSVFSLINFILNENTTTHLVCGILFIAWILAIMVLDRPHVEKTFLAFLGFVIFAPVVHPWYLSWLAALIVLRWSPAAFSLLIFSNLSNLVVYQYKVSGVWQDRPLVMLLEYLPFYALLIWETLRGRLRARLNHLDGV